MLDRLLAGQHAGAHHAGVAHQQRAAQLGVLAHHIKRILTDRRLERLHEVVSRIGELTADDDEVGIVEIDQSGDVHAEVIADLLEDVDAEDILSLCGIDQQVQSDVLRIGDAEGAVRRCEGRGVSLRDPLLKLPVHGTSARLCLETALLTAVAEYLVLERMDMPELAAEAGLAGVGLAVDDDTESETPGDIDVEDVSPLLTDVSHILSVGAGAGVVVDPDRDPEALCEDLAERSLAEIEVRVAAPGLGIDPAEEVEPDGYEILALDCTLVIDVVVDPLADLLEALGGVLKLEGDIHHLLYLIATEVHHHHVHLPLGEVHAEEVDIGGIQSEEEGVSSAGGLQLAVAPHQTTIDHLIDILTRRRHTQLQLPREYGEGFRALVDDVLDDPPLVSKALRCGVKSILEFFCRHNTIKISLDWSKIVIKSVAAKGNPFDFS